MFQKKLESTQKGRTTVERIVLLCVCKNLTGGYA